MILVDTNILLRIAQVGHPHSKVALDALRELTVRERERFAIAPQVLYEMYVAYTRPTASNGFGYSVKEAVTHIAATRALFELLPETPQVYHTWESLVASHQIVGKQAHDARLVAIMIEHHIERLMTFNDADFQRYQQVKAMNPFDVTGVPRT